MNIKQSTKSEKLAHILKTLGDPNRLRMVKILYQNNHELTCGEISQQLTISKSTVSYHFKYLRQAGLTTTRTQGQLKYLSLNTTIFEQYLPGFLKSL